MAAFSNKTGFVNFVKELFHLAYPKFNSHWYVLRFRAASGKAV
jgi:hypothetical protein